MIKPSDAKIKEWIVFAFGKEHARTILVHNFGEWKYRFESPVHVWSLSDYARRLALKKFFPEKFGSLDKDDNLNNEEFQIKKYMEW